MTSETSRRQSQGYAWTMLTLAPLFWAGNIVVARAVSAEVPPIGLTFWRWALAALIFLPFALLQMRGQWPAVRKGAGFIAALSLIGLTGFPICMYTGLQTTTALNASFIQALCPVVIPLVAWLMTKEKITLAQALGIAVSCFGALTIVGAGNPTAIFGAGVRSGDIWVFASMLLWSVYSVLVRRRPADLAPNVLLVSTMALASLITLPLWLWEAAAVRPMPVTLSSALAVGYIVLFPSIGSYFCFNRGIEIVGPVRGGLCLHLLPLFGALLAVLFLGESFRPYHAVGILAIFAGIVIVTRFGPRS